MAEDGTQSSDESVITAFPLTLAGRSDSTSSRSSGSYRRWRRARLLALEREGRLRLGRDEWDAKQSGGHYGYHYAAGLQILLDTFEQSARASSMPGPASRTPTSSEYRHREVGEDEGGLKFTGSEFTVGLRIGF